MLRVFRAHKLCGDCCLLDGDLGVSTNTSAQPGHLGAWKNHKEGWELPFPAWGESLFSEDKKGWGKESLSLSGGIFKSHKDKVS